MASQTVYSRALAREYREMLAEPKTAKQIMEQYDLKYPTVIKQLNSLISQGMVIRDPKRTSTREFVYRLKDTSAVPVVYYQGQHYRVDKIVALLSPGIIKRSEQPPVNVTGTSKAMLDFPYRFTKYVYDATVAASQGFDIETEDYREYLLTLIAAVDEIKATCYAILNHPAMWRTDEVAKWAVKGDGEKFNANNFAAMEKAVQAVYKKELDRMSGRG